MNDLPLKRIRGLRNRIVHNYAGLDAHIIYDTIMNDLVEVKARVSDFFLRQIHEGVFDPEELRLSRESGLYPRVDFQGS
jgi:uncharacterized protein YutE (UPF0331/DUF86 family)